MRNAYNTLNKSLAEEQNREVFLTVREFHEYVKKNLDAVGLDPSFLGRYLNEGFSGGEKKALGGNADACAETKHRDTRRA